MATAFLATASCAACVPINPDLGADDLDALLADLDAEAVLMQTDGASRVRASAHRRGLRVIGANVSARAPAGLFTLTCTRSSQYPPQLSHPSDIALVLHTSGTTARPKRVPLTHASLCASARQIAATLQLLPADRCLNVLPLFHVHGLVAALLATLTAGSSVACTPGFARGDFFAWLDALRPTWYTAVPTIHQAILDRALAQPPIEGGQRLRFIRSSSAPLPPRLATALEQYFGAPVISAYGMTEAAHQIASNPLPPGLRKPNSVGRAAGLEVAIMDDDWRPLPAGTTGEVVIRGAQVFAGDADDLDAIATAFNSARWFRTGDLGYLDSDGYLYLVGRRKEIVNRGGEKFSLQEVDDALLDHPAVAQAAAFRVPHASLGEDLAAAVVVKRHHAASAEDIRASLFGRLAVFKIPSELILVDELPTGPTGKLDRSRLQLEFARHLRSAYVAPRNEIEARVAAIVSEVTGVPSIGMNDNFFALGGDSLQAGRVLARIHAQLGANVTLVTIFSSPRIWQIAGAVLAERNAGRVALSDGSCAESASPAERDRVPRSASEEPRDPADPGWQLG